MKGRVATLVAVLCALACFNEAQAGFGLGLCSSKRQPMPNFELAKYAGRWFEISSFGAFFEADGKCNQAKYTPNDKGGIDFKNILVDKKTSEKKTAEGYAAQVQDGSNTGKLTINLPSKNKTTSLWILGTDYENYSVAYTCHDLLIFHYDIGWVLSRQPKLEDQYRAKVDDVIISNGLNPSDYTPQVQDCGILD